MRPRTSSWWAALRLGALLLGANACARGLRNDAPASTSAGPSALVLKEQGSFAVGGTVVTNPGMFEPYKPSADGATLHGDHAYVFYQIPVDARPMPLVFLHGAGQFSKTWETTPDGREGFQTIFLRRRFPVYLLDQPRRGNAGRSTVALNVIATRDDQVWYGMFRFGVWPDFFPGVQFSRDPEALNQFFRSMTPNTGPFDIEVVSDAVVALFAKIGPGVLVTHSQGGGPGWYAAMKSPNVRAVVSYEPGSGFVFPEGEVPPSMPSLTGPLESIGVPLRAFMHGPRSTDEIGEHGHVPRSVEREAAANRSHRRLHGERRSPEAECRARGRIERRLDRQRAEGRSRPSRRWPRWRVVYGFDSETPFLKGLRGQNHTPPAFGPEKDALAAHLQRMNLLIETGKALRQCLDLGCDGPDTVGGRAALSQSLAAMDALVAALPNPLVQIARARVVGRHPAKEMKRDDARKALERRG